MKQARPLTWALSRELAALQKRAASHDRGRAIRVLAVMLADGGDCLAESTTSLA